MTNLKDKTMTVDNVEEFIGEALAQYAKKNRGYDKAFWECALPLFAKKVRQEQLKLLLDKRTLSKVNIQIMGIPVYVNEMRLVIRAANKATAQGD